MQLTLPLSNALVERKSPPNELTFVSVRLRLICCRKNSPIRGCIFVENRCIILSSVRSDMF